MNFETICVVGLGYIGLPTATIFAARRKRVIGVDVNQYAVDTINRGEIHIVEPELDIAVHAAVKEGYLRATTAPEHADVFLVAVPTPFKKAEMADGVPLPDLSYIEAAAKSIASVLKEGNLVVLESTSPVGATEQLAGWLADARPDLRFPQQAGEDADVMIAYCPERVLPGRIMHELIENDRIIGGMNEKSSTAACNLYKTFVRGECLTTTARTAEMAKLTENAFRDVNIAFANELSVICRNSGIDVWELIRLANKHPRVNILRPGPGVGGHCIAVDPWFIVAENKNDSHIIKAARRVNDEKVHKVVSYVIEKINTIKERSGCEERDITVYLWGLSFKPDIDDMRESPALKVAQILEAKVKGVRLMGIEPNASPEQLKKIKIDFEVVGTIDVDKRESVVHVVLVAHKNFKSLEYPPSNTIDVVGISE